MRVKYIHKIKKRNKGSITVEAALVVPIFALAMLTLAFVMRLIYIDETMENSLNHVANNVSQYSYLYQKCGLQELGDLIDETGDNSAAKVEEQKDVILSGITKVNEFQTGEAGSISDFTEIKEQVAGMQGSVTDIKALIDKVKGDPKKEGIMILFAIGNVFKGNVANAVYEGITKQLFLMDLQTKSESYETKLGKMDLVDGAGNKVSNVGDALNFEGSTFNNGKDIKLVLSYRVKVPFPLVIKREFNMKNQVRVLSWVGDTN